MVQMILWGAEHMTVGMMSVVLRFSVEVLLLFAASRLCKGRIDVWRIPAAALVSAAYSAVCLSAGGGFPALPACRILVLAVTVWLAFGFGRLTLYRGCVYLLLSAAIGGLSSGMEWKELWTLLAGAYCLCIVCVFVSGGGTGETTVPVEVSYGGKKLCLTALRDTGNTLRDPLTGNPVLVIGADSAVKLTGLSMQQLKNPAETLCTGNIPGLRLIPYKTICNGGGMLLALKLKNVRIGTWRGNSLVAFAPETIGNGYEALMGGQV